VTLQLQPDQLQLIKTQAERTYPEECCGLLLGLIQQHEAETICTVVTVWQVENAWNASVEAELEAAKLEAATVTQSDVSKTNRYWIDPKDMLRAQRYARDRQLTIIGIYHSHTDHVAVPSECDRRLAWPEYSYLIVSVHRGTAQDLLSWKLDENHQFQPEMVCTVSPISLSIPLTQG
jgi:proteasome lid subunit RPN8/RPN11